MKEWEIWAEGFVATGQSAPASKLGSIEADSFDEAVKKYAKLHPNKIDIDRFGEGRHAIWGCELFPNRRDAQEAFG